LGTELLVDALLRAVKASLEITVFTVGVDDIDSTARDFYLKYEFILFHNQPLSLFLPIKTIIKGSRSIFNLPITKPTNRSSRYIDIYIP
jgi:hypothetical protein